MLVGLIDCFIGRLSMDLFFLIDSSIDSFRDIVVVTIVTFFCCTHLRYPWQSPRQPQTGPGRRSCRHQSRPPPAENGHVRKTFKMCTHTHIHTHTHHTHTHTSHTYTHPTHDTHTHTHTCTEPSLTWPEWIRPLTRLYLSVGEHRAMTRSFFAIASSSL